MIAAAPVTSGRMPMSDRDSDDIMGQLLELPLGDTWVVGAHLLPMPPEKAKEGPVWLTLIQSREKHFVLGMATHKKQPGAQELLDTLVNAMFEPSQAEPH